MKAPTRALSLIALTLLSANAPGQLSVRVSVKFILDASGHRPSNYRTNFGASSVALTNAQAVESTIDYANQLLAKAGRGYQFKLMEVLDVDGLSGFFDLNARDDANKNSLNDLVTETEVSRALYFWRDNAVNVYINNTSSGVCSFPPGRDIVFIGSDAYDTLVIHEIGHFLTLIHTHEGEDYQNADGSHCDAEDATCAQLIGGDNDRTDETLPDHELWTYAQFIFNNSGASSTQFSNTWFNIMSYHLPQDRFTPDQLDRWTDAANTSRNDVVDGRTVFVDQETLGVLPTGSSTDPYKKLLSGIDAASAGDIVLIRPGRYNEALTITKAVTLRATRGNAVIGR